MAYAPLSRIDEVAEKLLRAAPHRPQLLEDLEALQRMVPRIQAVLNDAEKMEIHDDSLRHWLRELKGVAYDAEDVLDEYEYELLRAKVEAELIQADETANLPYQQQKHKEGRFEETVRRRFQRTERRQSSYTTEVSKLTIANVSFCGKIANKIGEIRGRFEEISKQRDALHLREGDGEVRRFQDTVGRPPSSHLVDAPAIYGRRDDLEKVIDQLLCSRECKGSNLSVLPIVGMGGVGKTTLAQHVYNDRKVCHHFPLKGWVCVSDELCVEKLTARIIESLTQEGCRLSELSALQMSLIRVLDGKRFLLVLDDVWNQNPMFWESLQKPLIFGAEGSVVITTTRDEYVARIMQTMPFHHLDCLSIDDCWTVFRESAFDDRVPDDHQDLVNIGHKIVEKCGGLPLAAKSLGSLLCYENDVGKWKEVLQSNIWDLGGQGDRIIPALRLSYLYLPTYLKQCFLYTSLFPKDFKFVKEDLILRWMAQGFLQCKGSKEAEDVGNMYFKELVQRSFFQCHRKSASYFVMHDLVHDLAQHISDREFFHMQGEQTHVPCAEEVRHLSVVDRRAGDLAKMFQYSPSHHAPWAIRSLSIETKWPKLEFKFPSQMMLHLEFLRALDLAWSGINELPDSVGNLKLLRYLNLSGTYIVRLPDSVCKLYNLQALCLEFCFKLASLPKNVTDLCNLRCLKIHAADVYFVPKGIGKLTSLRTLDNFIVGTLRRQFFSYVSLGSSSTEKYNNNLSQISNAECSGIEELKDLVHLRGTLTISNLLYLMNAEDARLADLRNKRDIRELFLSWSTAYYVGKDQFRAPLNVQMQVMQNLWPPSRLQALGINDYDGLSFPSWMARDLSSLFNLIKVELIHCPQCTPLPPLGQLPSLKFLEIEGMHMVEAVGFDFYGHANVGFPALEKLQFSNMDKWVTWELAAAGRGAFPRLRYLSVCKCPKLESMIPLYLLPALEELAICLCRRLRSVELWSTGPSPSSCSSSTGPPPLVNMSIKNCPQARFLPEDNGHLLLPATLRVLDIDHLCPLLVDWCATGGGTRLAHISNAKVWRLGTYVYIFLHNFSPVLEEGCTMVAQRCHSRKHSKGEGKLREFNLTHTAYTG